MIRFTPGGIKIVDRLVQQSVQYSLPIYRRQVIKWLGEIQDMRDPRELDKLTPIDDKLEQLLFDALVAAYMTGTEATKKDIFLQDGAVQRANLATFADLKVDEMERILSKYPAAASAFLLKGTIDYDAYKRITGYAKSMAFSVARLNSLEGIKLVKDSLTGSFELGMGFNTWKNELREAFEEEGWTPLRPAHAETVFRTNMMSVYGAAKWDYCQAADNVAGYQYAAIMDSRVRPTHAAMNGRFYEKNNPIWRSWWPPIDYNCRCTVIPVTKHFASANKVHWTKGIPGAAKGGVGASFANKFPGLSGVHSGLVKATKGATAAAKKKAPKAPKITAAEIELATKKLEGMILDGIEDSREFAEYLSKQGLLGNTNVCTDLVSLWRGTSADDDRLMLLLQKLTAQKFNLTKNCYKPWLKSQTQLMDIPDDVMYHNIEAIYKNTQAKLAEAGIKYVKVYRGMTIHLDEMMKQEGFKKNWPAFKAEIDAGSNTALNYIRKLTKKYDFHGDGIQLQPLSSFSIDKQRAEGFAGRSYYNSATGQGGISVVLEYEVPAEKIFSMGGNGLGTRYEREVVVVSDTIECKVEVMKELRF